MAIRNRIVEHVEVMASELVPHELNYREHPEEQAEALAASYEDVGFARSLLGYRLADGRIQLIDGHLRRDYDPGMMVTVEVLDVTEEEAAKLLLTLDPLAGLARTNRQVHEALAERAGTAHESLKALWSLTSKAAAGVEEAIRKAKKSSSAGAMDGMRYIIHVECVDDRDQVTKLQQLAGLGYKCHARFG